MHRKSWINPCKQINTDELFRKAHGTPSYCKTPVDKAQKLQLLKTRIFGLSTQIHFQSTLSPKQTTKPIPNKNLKFRYMSNDSRKKSIAFNIKQIPPKQKFINRSPTSSTPKSTNLFQEISTRPNTSYYLSMSVLEHEAGLRPITNKILERSRINSTIVHMQTEPFYEDMFPDLSKRMYRPRFWKGLKTLKIRRRRKGDDHNAIILGEKVI